MSSGIVGTFAGTGADSFTGDRGPATAASLPGTNMMVTGDVYGTVFIPVSNRLHAVNGSTNIITWIAGECVAALSEFTFLLLSQFVV